MSSNQNHSAGSARKEARPAARTVGTGHINWGPGDRDQAREQARDAELIAFAEEVLGE